MVLRSSKTKMIHKIYEILCVDCKLKYTVEMNGFKKPLFCPQCGKKEGVILKITII